MSSFDRSSGLVYTETTSALVRSMVPTWMDHSTGRRTDPLTYRGSGQGSSSLQDMALRQCIWNIDSFETEALQYLGWHYASRMYEKLKRTNALTFNTWNLFRTAFPGEIDRHHQFNIPKDVFSPVASGQRARVSPPSQLTSVVNRLAKFETTPLTHVWLQGYRISIKDLMMLVQIPSLSVLALYHPPSFDIATGLDERNLKDWSRAVQESSAFQKLKVLILRGFRLPKDAVLREVSNFPALKLVGISTHDFSRLESSEESFENWSPFPSELSIKESFLNQEHHPSAVYENRRTPIGVKMNTLHRLSQHSPGLPLASTPDDLAVSIAYIGWDINMVGDLPKWYYRDVKEEVVSGLKRPSTSVDSGKGSENDMPKKKVVRKAKQKDVGSLLDSFL